MLCDMLPSFSASSDVVSVSVDIRFEDKKQILETDGLLVYIFVGSIILNTGWHNYIAGAIVGVTGVAYVVLEFIPSIEPPSNMREADQGWGAEQV